MAFPIVILFDFFGVLCSEVAPFWLADNLPAADAIALKQGLIHQADQGAVSQAEMFGELGRLSRKPTQEVQAEWTALATIDAEMVDLAESLRLRSRIALLSNCPAPFLRGLLGSYELEGMFEQIFISAELGIAKPDPAIFLLALERLQVKADSVLFIDDNSQNIAAAKDLGIRTIHFKSKSEALPLIEEFLQGA